MTDRPRHTPTRQAGEQPLPLGLGEEFGVPDTIHPALGGQHGSAHAERTGPRSPTDFVDPDDDTIPARPQFTFDGEGRRRTSGHAHNVAGSRDPYALEAMSDLASPNPDDGSTGAPLDEGTRVEVRNGFDGTWSRGFTIVGSTRDGYVIRRRTDGVDLPGSFAPGDVRRERNRSMWWV